MRDSRDRVSVLPLVDEHAAALEIDTGAVPRNGLPLYSERLFLTSANPSPMGDLDAPGRKWIEVSIGEQVLRAYQGNTLVSQTLISTGLDPNPTELGLFHVRL